MSPPTRHDDSVPVLRMVLAVAVVAALVILVFFAIGYGIGRVFV
jgi:preprotein translocase subunit SecE